MHRRVKRLSCETIEWENTFDENYTVLVKFINGTSHDKSRSFMRISPDSLPPAHFVN
jgi:hypothetical protein